MSLRLNDEDWSDALADELALALRCAPLSLREAERELWAAENSPLSDDEMRLMIHSVMRRTEIESTRRTAASGNAGVARSEATRRLDVERLEERKLLSSLLFLPC
jgi:hypothetical protein